MQQSEHKTEAAESLASAGKLNSNKGNHDLMLKDLAALANSFLLKLPDSIKSIEVLLKQSRTGDTEALDEAITIAHQIRGSAGTLGFSAIGVAFAALEDQFRLSRKADLLQDELAKNAIHTIIQLCRILSSADGNPSADRGLGPDSSTSAPVLTADARQEAVDKIADESGTLVLLVEDDPVFVSIVQAVLGSEENYQNGILSAHTLAEALQLLGEYEPDIILLDLALPDSEGIDTFHSIHKHAPDVPILILTALDETPLADESVACGAQDYLVKGRISPDALNRCIRYSITRFHAEKSMLRLRAIEDFNAALAHDLRVPVQGADRMLEHILAGRVGDLNEPLKNALTVLDQSNKEILDRLNKLLNLYRVEFGSVRLDLQQTDVLTIINQSVSDRMSEIYNKGLAVKIEHGDSSAEAYTDPQLLHQVMDELVNNAVKFAPPGDTITIILERLATKLAVRVSNSGQSIRQEEKKDLFRKFWRGTPGKSYVATSGLGLYYCHQIMNVLNGTIACRSNPDLTTFILRLPASEMDMSRSNHAV